MSSKSTILLRIKNENTKPLFTHLCKIIITDFKNKLLVSLFPRLFINNFFLYFVTWHELISKNTRYFSRVKRPRVL